jgi:hypothetical protein
MGALSKLAVKAAKSALKDAPYFAPGSPERAANLARVTGKIHPALLDAKGAPRTVYHGTYGDFDTFNAGDEGVFFSGSPKPASNYASFGTREGGNVIPSHLLLQNPLVVDDPGSWAGLAANYYDVAGRDLQKQARAEGNDGIIVRAKKGRKDASTYVVFDPRQIKSAIGNRGTFDLNDPDMRKARGGRVSSFAVRR